VSALVVIGTLLLAYGVYRVGKIFDVFASRYTLITMVPSVVGLREGAPVTVVGQRVGQVKSIQFIPVEQKHGDENLLIVLKVSQDVQSQIRADSRAYLRSQGLLGDKYVDISTGTAGEPILQEGDTLLAEQTMDIEMFLARGGAVLDSASRAVSDVHRITSGLAHGKGTMGQLLVNQQLYQRMVAATDQLEGTLHQFNDPKGTFGKLLHDPTLYRRVLGAVSRVDSLGKSIAGGQGTLGRLVQSDELYRSLYGGVSKADSALGRMSGLIGSLDNGQGTLQKLATDPQLYDEFLKAVKDLQTLIGDLRANPKKFVPPVNVRVF